MIAWLFWPSLVLLAALAPVWLVATFAPDLGVRIARFGSVASADFNQGDRHA